MEKKQTNAGANGELSALLIKRLGEAFGRVPATSADYSYLASAVADRTGEYVSPTTLKRLGGYLNEPVEPRRSTLDLLSRAMGYRDFSDFERSAAAGVSDSDPAAGHWLDAADMGVGDEIELTWFPDRRCRIRYLGDARWEVTESVATRLQPGQRFRCAHLIEGEPLQIMLEASALTERPAAYICGRQHGIRFRRF